MRRLDRLTGRLRKPMVWALTQDLADGDAWIYSSAINMTTAINSLAVERDSSLISLAVNGTYLGTITDASLPDNGYYGVANWASSYAPVTAYFDDYTVTVWDEPPSLAVSAWKPGAQQSIRMTEFRRR